MKVIAGLFMLVSVSIILVGGLTALQAQTDIGDTVVTSETDRYDQYEGMKTAIDTSMNFAGHSIWIILIVVCIFLATMALGALHCFNKM